MSVDIRSIGTMNKLITYFVKILRWDIDSDDFYDIEDIFMTLRRRIWGLRKRHLQRLSP